MRGVYTVKSTYRAIQEMKEGEVQGDRSDNWKIQVPAKVKNFLWSAVSRVLSYEIAIAMEEGAN